MIKHMLKLLILVFLLPALCYCESGSSATPSRSMQIKGSDTIVNLVQAWAEAFHDKNKALNIGVTGGGSGTGFAALINGTCDIAMSSRAIEDAEREQAKKNNINPVEYKIGLDGLMVIVNPKNPVEKLTLDELRDIFMGNVRNWKQYGGPDKKIVILSRESNSGTHVFFKEHVIMKGNKKSTDEFSPRSLLMPSSQAIVNEVMQNPYAVGYVGIGYLNPKLKALAVAKNTKSKYILPTIDTVYNDSYPISRPLFLYSSHMPEGHIKEFIQYAISDEGQEMVAKLDFVPVRMNGKKK